MNAAALWLKVRVSIERNDGFVTLWIGIIVMQGLELSGLGIRIVSKLDTETTLLDGYLDIGEAVAHTRFCRSKQRGMREYSSLFALSTLPCSLITLVDQD